MGIQINGQTDTISAFDNNFSLAGNVSIGGTLTYEDVTSVDAVGLSTFQAGIHLDDSIIHLGDTNTKIRFPAADTFTVETAGSEALRITSTGRQQSHAGYAAVGINTFASWARTGGAIRAEIGYNAETTDYMYFGTGTDHPVALRVNNDTALYIKNDASRSVGIGTDNPGQELEVFGNDFTGIRIKSSRTGLTEQIGGVGFSTSSDQVATINALVDGTVIVKNTTSGTERLRIKSNGAAYFTGNLGLGGQTSPSGTIHINNFGNDGYELKVTGNAVQFNRSSNSYIDQLHNSGSILFRMTSSNTEAMRITSGGKLLKSGQAALTSTSLSHPIQVASASDANAIAVFGRASDDIGELSFYEADKTTKLGELQYRQDHVNFRCRVGDIRFASGGTSETLRIDGSGRIAQGGKTPTNHGSPNLLLWGADPTLHLSATGSTNNSSFAGIKFAVAGGSTGDYSKAGIFVQRQDSYNDLDMIFAFRSTNNAAGVAISDEKLRIDSDGKLLIGTTSNFVRGQVQIIAGGGGELTIGRSDTSVASGNDLGHIFFASNDSGTTPSAGAAAISCYADADHTSSSAPASLRFMTCESGSVNTTERLRIHAEGHGQFYKGAVTRVVCASDVSLSGSSQVNDQIPSWATKITLILYRASLSGTADFLVQLRVNGSDISTNYNSGSANHTGNTHNTSTEGFIIANTNAGHKTSGRMVIERVGTDNKWVATHMVIQDAGQAPRYGAGDLYNYSGTISGLKVKDTGSNSFDNGTMTIIAEA